MPQRTKSSSRKRRAKRRRGHQLPATIAATEFVTPAKAAELLSVCTETVRRLLRAKKFTTAKRVGRTWRIAREEVLAGGVR